jgi:hypothetical protein
MSPISFQFVGLAGAIWIPSPSGSVTASASS